MAGFWLLFLVLTAELQQSTMMHTCYLGIHAPGRRSTVVPVKELSDSTSFTEEAARVVLVRITRVSMSTS